MENQTMRVWWQGKPVLTTVQLAQAYNCDPKNINNNFKYSQKYFIEGKHYFKLTGDDLRKFKAMYPALIHEYSAWFYLWTAEGIFLLGKILDSPKAWTLHEKVAAEVVDLDSIIFGLENAETKEETACAYALKMSDNTVKLGASGNLDKRKKQVALDTGLEVLDSYCTEELPRAIAFKIESRCHEFFSDKRAHGEFFNITFEDAISALERFYFDFFRSTVQAAVEEEAQIEIEALKAENARLRNQLPQINCIDFALVYILLMSNGAVKIGVTGNFNDRIRQIRSETGLNVLDCKTTPIMPRDDALKLEAKLKAKYADRCIGGEFFDVKFSEICAEF